MRSGGTIHLITLGVGPNSPLQSQHGSVVFLPFSNRNGSMLLGILEDEFASFCDTGTNFRVPFASPEIQNLLPVQGSILSNQSI